MERRQMLKYLLAGGLSAGISQPLQAQQRQPRPTAFPRSSSAEASKQVQQVGNAQVRPQNRPVVVISKELERVLDDWETKTAKITKLRGRHERHEYDSVFQIDKRAVGSFWYQSPDKGRIDFNVKEQPQLADQPGAPVKRAPNGNPYQVVAEAPAIWNCDGANILQVNIPDKTYDVMSIPENQRGANILDGPLPFLFGVKTEKLKARYLLELGTMHDPQGKRGPAQYHVVAKPREARDAKNWRQAEVVLNAKFCIPTAIRLTDPAGTKETVYVFDIRQMKANERLPWLSSPFKPGLKGYKLQQTATKEPEARKRSGGILPVNGSR